jgi:hypothetical protein
VFKKWHVNSEVLEKLFHERQEHRKSVYRRETHRDHKTPKNGTFKQNLSHFDNLRDIIKVTKSVIPDEKS